MILRLTLLCGLFLLPNVCQAGLMFTFSDNGTGGLKIVGTGSGTVTDDQSGSVWDILNFDSDFLAGAGSFTTPATGMLKNLGGSGLSSPMEIAVNEFRFDKDGAGDDIQFRLDDPITFMTDDKFEFTMMAEIASFDFSQLVAGTHMESDQDNADEIFGVTTLVVNAAVPEPTSILIFAAVPAALLLRRRS